MDTGLLETQRNPPTIPIPFSFFSEGESIGVADSVGSIGLLITKRKKFCLRQMIFSFLSKEFFCWGPNGSGARFSGCWFGWYRLGGPGWLHSFHPCGTVRRPIEPFLGPVSRSRGIPGLRSPVTGICRERRCVVLRRIARVFRKSPPNNNERGAEKGDS